MTTVYRYDGCEFSLSDLSPQIEIQDEGVVLIHRNQNESASSNRVWLACCRRKPTGSNRLDWPSIVCRHARRLDCERIGSAPSEKKTPVSPNVEPIHATVRVSALEGGFSFSLGFLNSGDLVRAERVLSAFDAGERYISAGRDKTFELPNEWLVNHARNSRVLLALNTRFKGLIPHSYAYLLDTEWIANNETLKTPQALLTASTSRHPEEHAFKGALRAYQQIGFDWLIRRYQLGAGGILADDMGLGKTIQMIACLASINRNPSKRHLVISPTSVHENWLMELKRFAPDLQTLSYYGPNRALSESDVVVTTYGVLLRDGKQLASKKWDCIVFDEAQAFKNPRSRVAREARRLEGHACFALTGTPFENHLSELWSLFEVILPGYLGRQASFKKEYARASAYPDSTSGRIKLEQLRTVAPYILRRHKSDVLTELLERQVHDIFLTLGEDQEQLYRQIEGRFRRSVAMRIQQLGYERARFTILEALTRLRQAACDPSLIPGIDKAPSSKRTFVVEMVHSLVAAGHRTLIFSQWPTFLKNVRHDLNQQGVDSLT